MDELLGTARLPPVAQQARILSRRYLACLAGEPLSMVLVVGQAPLIGWLCSVVWGSVETDTPSLWFVMCLSAVWLGCITACREIVRERDVLARERLLGLSTSAYLASKVAVLAGVSALQVVLLQGAVEWSLALHGPYLVQTLSLWLASMGGVGLGLVASALARRQEQAVAAVPPLLIPQILFSEFAIPASQYGRVVEIVEKAMPVRWAYRVFVEGAALEPAWGTVALSLLVQLLLAGFIIAMAWPALLPRRELG